MPTKVRLRRIKKRERRNKLIKEQAQMQSEDAKNLQTDSAVALADAPATSSHDKTGDSASTSTGSTSVEVDALDNNADSPSITEIASVEVDAAKSIEKKVNPTIAETKSKEVPSVKARTGSVEIPVVVPIEADPLSPVPSTPSDNADPAFIETAAGPSNPDKNAGDTKKLTINNNKFLENFNPETSTRERRKLNRQIRNAGTAKRHPGALYDENGIHIFSGQDICDCLFPNCQGCFYECPKCSSVKCGLECRVNRKFVYEQVDFEGVNLTLKFKHIAKEF